MAFDHMLHRKQYSLAIFGNRYFCGTEYLYSICQCTSYLSTVRICTINEYLSQTKSSDGYTSMLGLKYCLRTKSYFVLTWASPKNKLNISHKSGRMTAARMTAQNIYHKATQKHFIGILTFVISYFLIKRRQKSKSPLYHSIVNY